MKIQLYWKGAKCDIKGTGQQNVPFYIMSEEHKMTKQDRLVLTITLAAIFFGVFGLGLIGLIFNLSG